MLGELVDMVLEVEPGQASSPGSWLATVKGFKAVSDLFSVIAGNFGTRHPLLTSEACLTRSDPYERGWLYTAHGEPEPDHLDVHGYIAHLVSVSAEFQRINSGARMIDFSRYLLSDFLNHSRSAVLSGRF